MEKIKLINNVTSLQKLNYKINDTSFYMKRDDTIDFAFGGNKVRLFEYIAKLIKDSGADRVLTFGSQFSNFVRVTVVACALLSKDCDIIILEDDNNKVTTGGNSTLINYLNAHILRCPESQAKDFIDNYQNKLEKQGVNYFWIPGGGHIASAAFGYVDASIEMQKQLAEINVKIDAIFLPCGTGTTLSGISYGFSNYDVDIFGVTVARSVERCRQEVQNTLSQMIEIQPLSNDAICRYEILKCDIPYGDDCPEIQKVIKQVAISDGVFLDPIYNAKVFLTIQDFLHSHPEYKNVLYINTGGSPNIFIRK